MSSDKQYLDALRELVRQGTTGVAIFAVPLGLIVTQLQVLLANDLLVIKILATICLTAFSLGTIMAFVTRNLSEQLLAKELLVAEGNKSGKGFAYLGFMEEFWTKNNQDVSEAALISNAKKISKPVIACVLSGYGAFLLLILIAIWSPEGA